MEEPWRNSFIKQQWQDAISILFIGLIIVGIYALFA